MRAFMFGNAGLCLRLAAALALHSAVAAQPAGAAQSPTTAATSTTVPQPESISPPEPGKWQKIWIDRVKQFIEENRSLPPESRTIVFVGDSLTQAFKLKEYFPNLPVLNRGIGSDGICDFPDGRNVWRGVARRMKESIEQCRPSHLFLLCGTNDVGTTSIPLEYWFGAYKHVVSQTLSMYPDAKIVLTTVPPAGTGHARHKTLNSQYLKWNEMIRQYAKDSGFRLIDLHALLVGSDGLLPAELSSDGIHFNRTGYDRWANAVTEILRQDGLIAPNASPGSRL